MTVFVAALVLLGLLFALFYFETALHTGSAIFAAAWLLLGFLAPVLWHPAALLPLILVLAVLNLPPLRRALISRPVYGLLSKTMPTISDTEREALEAGTTWWDKELFCGRPDWQMFSQISLPRLTADEQSFIDNEVEQLCGMLDEWQIHHHLKDLPEEVWQFLRNKGFFGLIIPREYGGKAFSPYAQSRVMSKIATRSLTAAVTAMVPNSLGPGELLMKYGTDEQKQRWLPGLADGTELPCFGLTGPEAGSDAGAIPDIGIVCRGEHDGQTVIGLRLTFAKRWITLAPVATVIGLAFRLEDPEGLLGDASKQDYGITCALVPANHPGVETGRRHYPGAPFMNGPVTGRDVFIPLDWIIGGQDMAGKGWRMLIECLGVGRGISLPALATASGEVGYRSVGAFARIRRQFNIEIGKFEGVQEATAEIAALTYTLEAQRHFVTKGLEDGTPSVMTSMAKYHATEMMRTLINHGMDIGGGRAIQLGPRNFMALPYQSIPVAITVEGANILTRSLMIFGQGSMRCHPFLYDELQTLTSKDQQQGLKDFDPLFFRHVGYTLSRMARTLVLGLTAGRFSTIPDDANDFAAPWYRLLNRFSATLSVTADTALAVLGGDLKRRELLSARLGDAHSQLLLASAILKFHAGQPADRANDAHAEYALTRAFHLAQEALFAFYRNFPARFAALLVKAMAFPFGGVVKAPNDDMIRELGTLIMEPTSVRDTFGSFTYLSLDPEDALGRVECTYRKLLEVDDAWQAVLKAVSRGKLSGRSLAEQLDDAAAQGIIRQEDIQPLLEYDAMRYDCLLTDAFDPAFFTEAQAGGSRQPPAPEAEPIFPSSQSAAGGVAGDGNEAASKTERMEAP